MTGPLLAFDFETFLIADRTTLRHGSAEVNLSPYVTPRVVLGSLHGTHADGAAFDPVESPERMRALLRSHLQAGGTVVAHHFPFDGDVLLTAFPTERELWYQALAEGRVLDTKVLDVLYRLSVGYFDTPDPAARWAVPELRVRTLADLAAAYCGAELNKDDAVRLNFGQYEGRLDELPEAFRRYAAQDAIATYEVARQLLGRPGAPWDCAAQVRAEVALYALDKRGMAIDRAEALRLRALFSQDIPALQGALVKHGLGRWEPRKGTVTKTRHDEIKFCEDVATGKQVRDTGWMPWEDGTLYRERLYKKHWVGERAAPEFHLETKAIRERFEALARELELDDTELKRTDTGLLSVTYDEWADRIPADRPDLQAWGQHAKLTKILSAYLNLYAQVDRVFPRWRAIGARSGRMSASSPAVQQIPKRRYGIRSVFVPSPGHVFVVADYSCQEMYTLAEILHRMGLDGPLIEQLRAGVDIHEATARLVFAEQKGKITWPHAILHQFSALCGDVGSLNEAAGCFPQHVKDMLASRLTESESARIVGLLSTSKDPSHKACWSVIPVTHLRALTQTTYLQEHLPLTHRTWLEKAVLEETPLTVLDLTRRIGVAVSRGVIENAFVSSVRVSKEQRQGSKALNFGCPGGLGARRLAEYARKTFQLDWDLPTAKRMRERFLSVYPDIAAYLASLKTGFDGDLRRVSGMGLAEWKRELGVRDAWALRQAMRASADPRVRTVLYSAERSLTVTLPTGFVRKGCTFTEGANSYFQGLAAAVTKEAAWRAHAAGLCLVAVVHDEILVEATPADAPEADKILRTCMLTAFADICPWAGPFARTESKVGVTRWGEATTATGDQT